MKKLKFKKDMDVIREVMGEEEERTIKSVRAGVVTLYNDDGEADPITYNMDGREIGGGGRASIKFKNTMDV